MRNQVPIEVLGFLLLKIERGNACGRKGSIRDLQPGRQFYRCGTDGIHRDRDKLRHAGSTPRHSSNQQECVYRKRRIVQRIIRQRMWKN